MSLHKTFSRGSTAHPWWIIKSIPKFIFNVSHESSMFYSQLTNVDFYILRIDFPITIFNPVVSDIIAISLSLTCLRRIIDTSAPVSIVIAPRVQLVFPGIVGLLLLVKLSIFTSLGAFFLPAHSPKYWLLLPSDRTRQSHLRSLWCPHL